MSSSSSSHLPPGRPCFPHFHLKTRLPTQLYCDVVYDLTATTTNEMDMWSTQEDTSEWGNQLPVVHVQVVHTKEHAVGSEINVAAASASASSSTSAASSSTIIAASPSSPQPLRLSNASAQLTSDCKPLLSRAGKISLRFTLSPSPVILARTLASLPSGTVLSHEFYLHISVIGNLGRNILPALSGPHILISGGAKKGSAASAQQQIDTTGTYVHGEHGVHHALFVPLDPLPPATSTASLATAKSSSSSTSALQSVYSYTPPTHAHLSTPPAFLIIREILGVNLGGRIWDCGLLLFEHLRTTILPADPDFFRGKKIFEVGSGTGVVGLWLYAYVMLRNRRRMKQAERENKSLPAIPHTTFLLSDQTEAMDNLRENIRVNMDLLSGGQKECNHVLLEASELNWGSQEDHAGLAIQPTPTEPFDVILASDVVFNPIYFTPLLDSLSYLSGPGTQVLMAYRPRAIDKKQDEVFFKEAMQRGWTVKREAKLQDVFMLRMVKGGVGGGEANVATPVPIATPSPVASPSLPEAVTSTPATTIASTEVTSAASATPSSQPSTSTPSVPLIPVVAAASASLLAATAASTFSSHDPFSLVTQLHTSDLESGYREGSAAAWAQSQADGEKAGYDRGTGIASELGFYHGFVEVWKRMGERKRKGKGTAEDESLSSSSASSTSSHPHTLACQQLHTDFLSSPLYTSGFAPSHVDPVSIATFRTRFKEMLKEEGVMDSVREKQLEQSKRSF